MNDDNAKRDLASMKHPISTVKPGAVYDSLATVFSQLVNCSQYITPDCLRALYLIPPVITNIQKNPLGIVEYTPQAYVQSDLVSISRVLIVSLKTLQGAIVPQHKAYPGTTDCVMKCSDSHP